MIFISFWCFSMKIFAHIMGLLFGSAGAHTFPKSGHLPKKVRKHKMFPQHCLLAYCFFPTNFLRGGRPNLLSSDLISGRAKSPTGTKCLSWAPLALPPVRKSHHRFDLSIQSFCPAALTYQILQFCLFRKDSFDRTGSRYLWNFSWFSTIACTLRWWTGICRFYAVFLPPP